jgi:hypothetical protein
VEYHYYTEADKASAHHKTNHPSKKKATLSHVPKHLALVVDSADICTEKLALVVTWSLAAGVRTITLHDIEGGKAWSSTKEGGKLQEDKDSFLDVLHEKIQAFFGETRIPKLLLRPSISEIISEKSLSEVKGFVDLEEENA